MYNGLEDNNKIKESSSSVSLGIGGTLIMVIFVSLCLTILATLSFTTAYSDLKLSKKTQVMTKDYYVASGRAEERLSQIYEEMLISKSDLSNQLDKNISLKEDYYFVAKNRISKLEDLRIIESRNIDKYYIFTIYYESLGDFNQKICATLNIYYDELKTNPYYEIVTWNLSNIEIPSYEEGIYDLWEGIDW